MSLVFKYSCRKYLFSLIYLLIVGMNQIQNLKDSIETSINLKLFTSIDKAFEAHICKSQCQSIPLKIFQNNNVLNFSSSRLQKNIELAYPWNDRPRKEKDIASVKYHIKQIQRKKTQPIWLLLHKNKYTLLDGAHRVVAHYISSKRIIKCYVISI